MRPEKNKLAFLLFLALCLALVGDSDAQESITITTYYPSPYGSYNELTAKQMKIGSAYSGADTAFVTNGLIVEGNVGIGTATPNYKLHINNGAADPWLQFTDAASGTTANDGFLVGANDSGAYLIQRENRFLRFRTNNIDRLSINNAGNVGIGTATPVARLQIPQSSDAEVATANSGTVIIGNPAGTHITMDANEIIAKRNATSGGTLYLQNETKNGRDAVYIGGGTVGFGGSAASPATIINKGNGSVTNTNGQSDIWFDQNGGIAAQDSFFIFIDADNNNSDSTFRILKNAENRADATTVMQVGQWSDAVIGPANPVRSVRLRIRNYDGDPGDPDRSLVCESDTGANILEVTNSKVFVNGSEVTSDLRLKKNIRDLPQDTLDRVLKLKGVSFEWKDMEGKNIGMIAQEVEKYFPELVSESESENRGINRIKHLSYDGFTAVLLEAVKTQQKQISDLQVKIKGLEEKIRQ